MGAPRPRHDTVRPSHLDRLACETCHIPVLNRAAGEGFDVTAGTMVNYPKTGSKGIGAAFAWQPRFQLNKQGKLSPVNVLLPTIWTNRDADGIYSPLMFRDMKKAYDAIAPKLAGKAPNKPELHTPKRSG